MNVFTGQHWHALTNVPVRYDGEYEITGGQAHWRAHVTASDGSRRELVGTTACVPPALPPLQAVLADLHRRIDANDTV